jgi:hypothetical protein
MPERKRAYADDTLESVSAPEPSPTITDVLRFEDLPLGSRGTRRAVVRWSDGSESEALCWNDDLCGSPHKSSYADERVMQGRRHDRGETAPTAHDGSA